MRRFAALLFLVSSAGAISASDFALDPARLADSAVKYDVPAKIAAFPVPVISARRAGLASGPSEFAEIKEKILYPLIVRSPTAVSAVVLEWLPAHPEGLGVSVIWADGRVHESLIPRVLPGHYDDKAYEVFFKKPTP